MARFDVTNYIKTIPGLGEDSQARDILQWLVANVGPYSEEWLNKTRLTAEQVTNYAIGTKWSLNVVAASLTTPEGVQARGFNLRWILEIEDDAAAMQFKLTWPEAKVK